MGEKQFLSKSDQTCNVMIVHCMKRETWNRVKDKSYFGEESIETEGFIHCSPVDYLWRVTPNFKDIEDDLVILCIDTNRLESEVRWEDGDNCVRYYPHVYGLINMDAVTSVLPYLKDEDGTWIKNEEFENIPDK